MEQFKEQQSEIEDIKTYCEKDVEASIEVSKKLYK